MPDENDDDATSVRGVRRENARPGVGAIRSKSRESTDPENELRLDSWIQEYPGWILAWRRSTR